MKLTPAQIENWRFALALRFGEFAFMLPDSDIQMLVDKLQNEMDERELNRNKEVAAKEVSNGTNN